MSRIVFESGSPPYACPCCRCLTLRARGHYDICPVCFWEDDGQDDITEDYHGGPNGGLSLAEARTNYQALGACDERSVLSVRRPMHHELPPD
jgi:Cysteine-rich CPCC